MPNKTLRRSAKESLDGSHFQQGSNTSAAKLPTTTDIEKKKAEEAKMVAKDTAERRKEELGPRIHSSSDDRPRQKVQPGYTEP